MRKSFILFHPDRDRITGELTGKYWWMRMYICGIERAEIVPLEDIKRFIGSVKAGEYDWILDER